jgi:hypothetical protein
MIVLLLLACGAPEAGPGATVLPPDDVVAAWDEAYAEADDMGGIFPMQARVIGPDGDWLAGVRISVVSGWDGALVLPADAEGEPVLLDARTGDAHALGSCADQHRAGCTWLEGATDAEGLFRFVLFVDLAPDSGAKVPVFVSSGSDIVSVEVTLDSTVVVQ